MHVVATAAPISTTRGLSLNCVCGHTHSIAKSYPSLRGVNWSWSGGSVTVKVSSISWSKCSPFSPGANATSKFWAIIAIDVRRLNSARFLPGQLYAPKQILVCLRLASFGSTYQVKTADRERRLSSSPPFVLRIVQEQNLRAAATTENLSE
jgi:hypothetical protein